VLQLVSDATCQVGDQADRSLGVEVAAAADNGGGSLPARDAQGLGRGDDL